MSNRSRRGRVGGRLARPHETGRASSDMRVQSFALSVWEALGTPLCNGLHMSASAGDWKSIVKVPVDPSHYTDPLDFFLDYQAAKLMSKNPHLPTGLNTRKAAERKFIEAEVQCLKTNERFRDLSVGVSPKLARILHAAQRKIADVLGDVPSFEKLDFSFGPGANLGVRGETTVYHKLTAILESTHSMVAVLPDLLGQAPGWIEAESAEVALVNGSDLSFVPKDATTDRAICIEPLLNGFMQKGIGKYIRNRLRRHGIDLLDQSVNQRLARDAFRDQLSTVDFSSASDTIAYNLVWNLLPPDWCELLDASRCPSFRYEGKWFPFQKFSSMGNAYTFELETLIFYALAYACCVEEGIQPSTGLNLSVYGDDVIIPRGAFDLFREVSEFCGFTLNVAKSYKDGAFYESCGVDSFLGNLVTPLRLKQGLAKIEELFYAANFIVRLAKTIHRLGSRSKNRRVAAILERLAGVHRWLVSLIPRHRMVYGPNDEGDGWLICPFDRARPSTGTFGFRHRRLTVTPALYKPADGQWPMSYALYSIYRSTADTSILGDLTPIIWSEGAALRSKTRTRVVQCWSNDWHYPLELATVFWQGY